MNNIKEKDTYNGHEKKNYVYSIYIFLMLVDVEINNKIGAKYGNQDTYKTG
jgi:hypothetical protein